MNKREYKKKHSDLISRMKLKRLVEWCNLYKRDLKGLREQSKGKFKKKLYCPKIDKLFIKFYKEQL